MRISDWSSDVCSSDLSEDEGRRHRQAGAHHVADHDTQPKLAGTGGDRQSLRQAATFVELDIDSVEPADERVQLGERHAAFVGGERQRAVDSLKLRLASARDGLLEQRDVERGQQLRRSAEHTSELQSLMRLSY